MTPDWIAVDWGTSNLRAWAMGPSGVLASAGSDEGMGKLSKAEFEPALLRVIATWLGTTPMPVIGLGVGGFGWGGGWGSAWGAGYPAYAPPPPCRVTFEIHDARVASFTQSGAGCVATAPGS